MRRTGTFYNNDGVLTPAITLTQEYGLVIDVTTSMSALATDIK